MVRIATRSCFLLLAVCVGAVACTSPNDNPARPSAPAQPATPAGGSHASTPTPTPAPGTGDGTVAKPVGVPMAAGEIKVDGDAADWAKIPSMPAPFAKKASGLVKLAWRADGLYGLATVPDKDIKVDDANPWAGDCLEVFIEKDCARSPGESNNSAQYGIAPGDKPGACIVRVPWGGLKDSETAVKTAWAKTDTGYNIEFFFPADTLAVTAKLQAGTKMGLNYAVDDDGQAVEQFYSDKNTDEGYHTPSTWGVIILSQ